MCATEVADVTMDIGTNYRGLLRTESGSVRGGERLLYPELPKFSNNPRRLAFTESALSTICLSRLTVSACVAPAEVEARMPSSILASTIAPVLSKEAASPVAPGNRSHSTEDTRRGGRSRLELPGIVESRAAENRPAPVS